HLQENVTLAAQRFAEEFNGEALRAVLAFNLPRGLGASNRYSDLYLQWAATATYPQMVRNVFIAEMTAAGGVQLSSFNSASRSFEGVDWPAHLLDLRQQLEDEADGSRRGPRPTFELFRAADPPTAIFPLLSPEQTVDPFPVRAAGRIIIEFDQER